MSPGQGRLILKGKKELWCVVACPCQAWWCTLVTLALGISRQEDHRSEASLGYITGSVPEKDEGGGEEAEGVERVKEGGKEKQEGKEESSIAKVTEQTHLPNPGAEMGGSGSAAGGLKRQAREYQPGNRFLVSLTGPGTCHT